MILEIIVKIEVVPLNLCQTFEAKKCLIANEKQAIIPYPGIAIKTPISLEVLIVSNKEI